MYTHDIKTTPHKPKLGPHWLKLLAADCAITLFAGVAAYAFNHGLPAAAFQIRPLATALPGYMLCYMCGFLIFGTFNSFMRLSHADLWRSLAALCTGTAIITAWNSFVGHGEPILDFHDLCLQATFTLIGMNALRAAVRAHYSFYIKRSDSGSGAYGLSDMALLNMEMSELLHRKPIKVDTEAIHGEMHGKRIMVTGAGGSIGSELVNLLAGYEPASLVLVDQAETPLHDVRMMMERQHRTVSYTAIVTDVCHSRRMERIFEEFRPQVIFHAAAYKHVPMMEDNPVESVLNNVDGTVKLANLAVRFGVDKFVMISTDKAVNPTSIMGCSKRICEIYCQSLARDAVHGGQCQFITTRFGNVLGSNGSVVPTFREQIRRGGPVRVTHPDIIRFFMLINEACHLVLEAATIGHGGEIFAFDMGEPVRIADLARKMIAISHRPDIRIEYTGLRPGEKLYEEVLNDDETVLPTSHDKIKIAKVREYDFAEVNTQVESLIAAARTYDTAGTVQLMSRLVPEYRQDPHKNR